MTWPNLIDKGLPWCSDHKKCMFLAVKKFRVINCTYSKVVDGKYRQSVCSSVCYFAVNFPLFFHNCIPFRSRSRPFLRLRLRLLANRFSGSGSGSGSDQNVSAPLAPAPAPAPHPCMGGNGEPLAHGRIWSGPLKLLLPALGHHRLSSGTTELPSLVRFSQRRQYWYVYVHYDFTCQWVHAR